MKAYICTTEYDGAGGVVFAKSNLAARKISANEWNDGELGGMHVNRAPSLDQYFGAGVPAKVLIRDFGWSWEDGCANCGRGLNAWQLEEDGIDIEGVVGTDTSLVFCCQSCSDAYSYEKEMKNNAGMKVIEFLIEYVKRMFDGVSVKRTHHFTTGKGGLYTTEQAIVDFDFPGSRYGASIRMEDRFVHGRTIMMPHIPYFTCANGDLEAWNRMVENAKT